MLGILVLFIPSIAFLVIFQGCCNGKKERSSSELKSTLSKKEPSKRQIGKPGGEGRMAKKPQGGGNVIQNQPQAREKKEEVEPAKAAAAEEGKSGMKDELNRSKGSKKGKSSKKGKKGSLEPTQTRTDEEQQKPQEPQQPQGDQKTERIEPQAVAKEPNEFEKAAANERTVVNPQKVKRMGNIDEIYEAKKEEQNKELENLKSVVSSVKSKDPGAGKKVSINEAKCVLFETADCPTLDDDENDNGEDPI